MNAHAHRQGHPREHQAHPHDHGGHDHGAHGEPGRPLWARGRHAVSHLVGGHSHDPADQVDDALEADASGRRALWLSMAFLGLTTVLQAIVVVWSGSVALLGDTLHNAADALTAVPILVAFTLARRPPNERFTCGYGRAEDLAGLFVVLAITLSAVLAAYEAIQRLLHPQQVTALPAVALAGVVGFLGNEAVARYRTRVGERIGSAALVADGLHARTDGFTSLAVVAGAAGVAVGWPWADPVIGLLIALAIAAVLRSAATQVGHRLMDAVDPELTAHARATLATVPGVHEVAGLRLRWSGHTLHAEAALLVDPVATAEDLQAIGERAEAALRARLKRLGTATIANRVR